MAPGNMYEGPKNSVLTVKLQGSDKVKKIHFMQIRQLCYRDLPFYTTLHQANASQTSFPAECQTDQTDINTPHNVEFLNWFVNVWLW